jgi:sugar-phosphatase
VKAVLFDVDGVLLNSWAAHRRIWRTWTDRRSLDFEVVWAATHGRRIVETLADVAPELDPVVEEQLLREIMLAEGEGAFPAHEGARDLLACLPAGRWGIVTSAKGDNVRERFRAAGLPAPEVLIDNGAVSIGKPSPEGYLAGAAALGAAPQDCLVVEDAPAGITAGISAGMRVLAVATTHTVEQLADAHSWTPSLEEAAPEIRGWLGLGAIA